MFLNENFLLKNEWSQKLYHDHAAKMPIIDYHCHLDPQEIYEDKNFETITEAWLKGDHYKWRLMRANGVPETHITGSASDYDKFLAWCQTVPKIVGNPLYTWTHLELRRFFDIDLLVNPENAKEIWDKANAKLAEASFSRRGIIRNSKVKVICTTDDPIDDLNYHQLLANEESEFKVFPTFRPDKALNIDKNGFNQWIDKLSEVEGASLTSYEELIDALKNRVAFFHELGCRLSDHALDILRYKEASISELNDIFTKARKQEKLTESEVTAYRTETLIRLIHMYHEKNWAMQLHIHAYRDCNEAMFEKIGPDTGYDGLNDLSLTIPLQQLLNRAEKTDQLPKTILYSLNPNDFTTIATLMGSYQKDVPGKLQLGSGWWYNDTLSGMRHQLTVFADNSPIANFVGMLTDSRSFLSYTRHEYFRRVLCDFFGEIVERGELPTDEVFLGKIIEDISFNNALNYFNFKD